MADDEFELIDTSRKHKKGLYKGKEYLFSYMRKSTGEEVYRCAEQWKTGCKVLVNVFVYSHIVCAVRISVSALFIVCMM